MNSSLNRVSTFADTKKHYEILDGLRGVAAILVVIFHLFETFTMGDTTKQIVNHGYLAVDFFFVLSGFVIGYAYDDRWKSMSIKDFFKRRLIRLHPMIIIGMIVGAILFYTQSSFFFPAVSETPVWKMLLVMVIGFTILPVGKSLDIRGWNEMHPLNGPVWSLFFEYIANIIYALFIRKFSNKVLTILIIIAGAALVHLSVTKGNVIGGWSFDQTQLRIGFTRLLYPFLAGLLLSRIVKPGMFKNAFLWSSLLLIAVLSMPYIGTKEHVWVNGLYVALSIIVIFPFIVYIGASGKVTGKYSSKLCKFLGDISYPIYIIHYPLIYTFMAWVAKNKVFSIPKAAPAMIVVLIVSILLAWISFKFFDLPVRNWLTKRFMKSK